MSDHDQANDQAFEAIEAEGRIAAEARMLSEDEPLQPNQRRDIIERFRAFSAEHGYTQVAVAREIGVSAPALSDGLMRRAGHTASDKVLVRLHNWMELTARRRAVSGSRKFVVTSVAREILTVAKTVAETLKIGVVWGPAQIGKSMSLAAIEGDQAFGAPILVRVDESIRTPLPFCRALSRKQALKQSPGRAVLEALSARGIHIRTDHLRGLAEEAPVAYKDIHQVVEATAQAGLAKKVARLLPLACLKG